MSYRELMPDARLSEHVDCYWTSEVLPGEAGTRAVLPDGCIDLIFDATTAKLEVVGTMTRAVFLEGRGPAQFVGVRFKPGGAVPFLHERADRMTDRVEDSALLLGREAREVQDVLTAQSDLQEQVRTLERFLLSQRPDPVDRRVALLAAKLSRDPALKIEVLARDLALSRQYLRRLFLEHTGVAPKLFARIARVRRAVEAMARASLAEAALAAGYADQAHLSNEFKELVGITPASMKRTISFASASGNSSIGK